MHAPELATRLANKGIALHIAAPGPLASRLFENASQEIRDHVRDMTVQGIQNEKSSGPHLGA
jgi:hypothetical protein